MTTRTPPGTATIVAFCPNCQGNEIKVEVPKIIGTAPNTASCQLCGWQGPATELLCAIGPQTQHMWDGERVANVLLYAATRFSAGPMLQVLELLGLIPALPAGNDEERASAEHVRSEVLKAVLEATTTAAFEKAAELAPAHYAKFNQPQAEATSRVFSYAQGAPHGEA